jgi:hypothetical protein
MEGTANKRQKFETQEFNENKNADELASWFLNEHPSLKITVRTREDLPLSEYLLAVDKVQDKVIGNLLSEPITSLEAFLSSKHDSLWKKRWKDLGKRPLLYFMLNNLFTQVPL